MNDIKRASTRRIREAYEKAGFTLRSDVQMDPPVRFWLYSCCLTDLGKQPRMVAQITSELYTSMLTGSGLLRQLATNPVDALAYGLQEFDKKDGLEGEDDRQILTALLASYVMHTQTWKSVKPLSRVPGIHVLVVDWKASGQDGVIIRPAIRMDKDGIMTNEEVVSFQEMVMAYHFGNHPGDKPDGW